MKQLIQIVVILAVVLGTVAIVIITSEPRDRVQVDAIQPLQQPQRERYQPPEWVINERGQRCIRQGTTVTCG
jgi:hypothetical protein